MKNTVKSIIFLCLFVVIALPQSLDADTSGKIRVVTSTPDLAAIARAVGGDKVEVSSIAIGSQNLHFVPARPSHILKLKNADLLVQVGMGLEPWLPPLVESSRNAKIFLGSPGFVDASQGVTALNVPNGRVDRSMGDVHSAGNPHYWLDPVNAKIISGNILQGLKRADSENAAYYEQQRQAFLKQLASQLTGWMKRAQPLQGEKVITYHDSWPYFSKRFGLKVVGFIEPKPGITPSPKHIQSLIRQVKQEKVSLIIMEPYFNRSAPDMIAAATGARVVVLPPSVGGVSQAKDYWSLFDTLLDTMLKNL